MAQANADRPQTIRRNEVSTILIWEMKKHVHGWVLVALIQLCLCGVTDQYEILALHYQSHFSLSPSKYLLLFTVVLWPNLLSIFSALLCHWFSLGLIGLSGLGILTASHILLVFASATRYVPLAFLSRFLIGLGRLNAFDIALLPLLGRVFTPRQVTIAATLIRLISSLNTLISIYANVWLLHKFGNSLTATLLVTSLPLLPCLFFYWRLVTFVGECERQMTEMESAEAMVTQDQNSPWKCLKALPPAFWLLLVSVTILLTASILFKAAQMTLLQFGLGLSEQEATHLMIVGCVTGFLFGGALTLVVFRESSLDNHIQVGLHLLLFSMCLYMGGCELLQDKFLPLIATAMLSVSDIIQGSWAVPVLLTAAGPCAVYVTGVLSTGIFVTSTFFSQIQGIVIEHLGPLALAATVFDMILLSFLLLLLVFWMLNGTEDEKKKN